MRAMVFHGPGDLRREELAVPEPGPGEIVVRIDAALTCGTDVKTLRRGHPGMILGHAATVTESRFARIARFGVNPREINHRVGDSAIRQRRAKEP